MELPTPEDLRRRRKAVGLKQAELAARADVSQPLIARVENDDVEPRLSTRRRIVEALGAAEGDVVRARDLMHTTVVSVSPDDSVHDAVDLMNEEAYSQLAVIQNGVPVGSISQSDVVHAGENVGDLPVAEVMSESFPTVSTDATADEVRNLLDHYKAVVVTEDGESVGIITEADIARHLS